MTPSNKTTRNEKIFDFELKKQKKIKKMGTQKTRRTRQGRQKKGRKIIFLLFVSVFKTKREKTQNKLRRRREVVTRKHDNRLLQMRTKYPPK